MSINGFYEDNSIGRTFAVKPDIRQKVLTSDAGDDGNLYWTTKREEKKEQKKFVICIWYRGDRPPSRLTY